MIFIIYVVIGIYLIVNFKKVVTNNKIICNNNSNNNKDKNISSIQSLIHSLSSSLGTANIIGVSIIILSFGPGVIFWMIVQALIGSFYRFYEAFFSVKYRIVNKDNENVSGPMYYLSKIDNKLGILYAFFCLIVSLTLGVFIQGNSIYITLNKAYNINKLFIAVTISILVYLSISKGIKNIVKITDIVIPFVSIIYILACFIILFHQRNNIMDSFIIIFIDAFNGKAVVGSSLYTIIKYGIVRGLFSNEAGIGSGSIAHGASYNNNPVKEGFIAMLNPLIDTVVLCLITSIVILSSGLIKIDGNHIINNYNGEYSNLIIDVFNINFNDGDKLLSFCMFFFAFASILGWYYFGEKSIEYLYKKKKAKKIYTLFFSINIGISFYINTEFLYKVTDVSIMFLLIPNIIGLFILVKNLKDKNEKI